MNQKYLDKLEQLDWIVNESESWIELEKYSPAGEDFIFSVSVDNFVDEIKEYAADFDPDEHVTMWVEAKYNGAKNIPSIRELVEDADAIDEMLQELAIAMCEIQNQVEQKQEDDETANELLSEYESLLGNEWCENHTIELCSYKTGKRHLMIDGDSIAYGTPGEIGLVLHTLLCMTKRNLIQHLR